MYKVKGELSFHVSTVQRFPTWSARTSPGGARRYSRGCEKGPEHVVLELKAPCELEERNNRSPPRHTRTPAAPNTSVCSH
ncbi:hypothetical protein FHG87_002804 [Trinorchestia longiramus]|nr:hypothetical protein FHG87_002804 [Trinorchestia longiramus]